LMPGLLQTPGQHGDMGGGTAYLARIADCRQEDPQVSTFAPVSPGVSAMPLRASISSTRAEISSTRSSQELP